MSRATEANSLSGEAHFCTVLCQTKRSKSRFHRDHAMWSLGLEWNRRTKEVSSTHQHHRCEED